MTLYFIYIYILYIPRFPTQVPLRTYSWFISNSIRNRNLKNQTVTPHDQNLAITHPFSYTVTMQFGKSVDHGLVRHMSWFQGRTMVVHMDLLIIYVENLRFLRKCWFFWTQGLCCALIWVIQWVPLNPQILSATFTLSPFPINQMFECFCIQSSCYFDQSQNANSVPI